MLGQQANSSCPDQELLRGVGGLGPGTAGPSSGRCGRLAADALPCVPAAGRPAGRRGSRRARPPWPGARGWHAGRCGRGWWPLVLPMCLAPGPLPRPPRPGALLWAGQHRPLPAGRSGRFPHVLITCLPPSGPGPALGDLWPRPWPLVFQAPDQSAGRACQREPCGLGAATCLPRAYQRWSRGLEVREPTCPPPAALLTGSPAVPRGLTAG